MSPKAIMGIPVPHKQEQGHLRRSSCLLAGSVLLKWMISNTKRLYHSTTPLSCLLFPPEAYPVFRQIITSPITPHKVLLKGQVSLDAAGWTQGKTERWRLFPECLKAFGGCNSCFPLVLIRAMANSTTTKL